MQILAGVRMEQKEKENMWQIKVQRKGRKG